MLLTKNNKDCYGFTLIELLVVIVIIGIIATLATVAMTGMRRNARDAKRISDLKQIATSVELYYSDHNAYPTYVTPGLALKSADSTKTYMPKVPSNPTPRLEGVCSNSDYQYSGSGEDYSLLGCISKTISDTPAGLLNYGKGGSIRNDGLVGRWIVNELTDATLARDASGNGNNLTVASGVTRVADHNGRSNAAYINGADGRYLYILGETNFVVPGLYGSNGKATFNFGLKVQFRGAYYQNVIRKGTEYNLWLHVNQGPLEIFLAGADLVSPNDTFADNTWYFVTVVYDITQPLDVDKVRMYKNGQRVTPLTNYGTFNSAGITQQAATLTTMLADPNGNDRFLVGPMDYLDIRGGVAMTQPEITALYNTWLNQ